MESRKLGLCRSPPLTHTVCRCASISSMLMPLLSMLAVHLLKDWVPAGAAREASTHEWWEPAVEVQRRQPPPAGAGRQGAAPEAVPAMSALCSSCAPVREAEASPGQRSSPAARPVSSGEL